MALVTTLTIRQLEVQYILDGLVNVIISVQANLSGNNSGYTSGWTQGFTLGAPVSSSFIPFDSLTEADVINFVKATDLYDTTLAMVTNDINKEMQTPTQGICAFPW